MLRLTWVKDFRWKDISMSKRKEMYVALVMKEGMQGVDGAFPDLILVKATDTADATIQIQEHAPDHPRWQKKSVIRVVMIFKYATLVAQKLIPAMAPERIVRVPTHKRRRRKVQS